MASARTDYLGLIVFPDITGVYQRELRIALVTGANGNDSNMHIIDAAVKQLADAIDGVATVTYTKAEVDQMLADMSELLISSNDEAALFSAVNTLMGETTPLAGLGASIMAIDSLADEILS